MKGTGVIKVVYPKKPKENRTDQFFPGKVVFVSGVQRPTFDDTLLKLANELKGREVEYETDETHYANLTKLRAVEPLTPPTRVPVEPRITDSKDKDRIVAVVEKISRDFAELAEAIKKEGRW